MRSIGPSGYLYAMTISAADVTFDETTMWVLLEVGRVLGVPLARFPLLVAAAE